MVTPTVSSYLCDWHPHPLLARNQVFHLQHPSRFTECFLLAVTVLDKISLSVQMSLRGKLLRRSVKSISGRDYFPESWLLETLSKPEIQHAVETCVVDATKRKEAVNVILNGGRRVFAILVIIREESMLVDFMETDNLLQNTLDSRLPLDFSTIRQLLPENPESDVVAKEFCDRQWEVLAPIFGPDLSHRVFDNMAIMPFLWGSSKKAGEGGFGFVDRVTLHEAHHGFGPRGQNSVGHQTIFCVFS